MQDSTHVLIEKIRQQLTNYKPAQLTLQALSADLGLPLSELTETFRNEAGLVEEILKFENHNLEAIFTDNTFEEDNAIDGLLEVSKVLSDRFRKILPVFSFDLKEYFPELQQKYFTLRFNFVFDKISRNIRLGINQGLYRPDLSKELVSRIYISRLIDLHNPDFFPPDQFSFNTLFNVMFDTFIRGIVTEEGVNYYENKVKSYTFQ